MKTRQLLTLGVMALMVTTLGFAGHTVAVLDGTSWKIEAEPDDMAQKKGAQQFKDVLVFAEGRISLRERGKGGAESGSYAVTSTVNDGKEHTFKAELPTTADGRWTWTGTVKGGNMEGKLIQTRLDGSVLTYTFKGNQLD